MDINSIKTSVKQHKYITLKQKDNTSSIDLILCGSDGKPLSSLSGACTITLLDLVDKKVRSTISGQVNGGVVSFKVTDHLKANPHSIEINVGGRRFPSDGDFIVQVSMSHDQVELNVIASQTAQQVADSLYSRLTAYMAANPNLFKGAKGDAFKYTDFTQAQLDALKGPKGDTGAPGPTGAPFTYSMFTSAQLAALKGDKGDKGDPFKYSDFTSTQLNNINTQVASLLQPNLTTQVQNEFSKLSAKQQQDAEVINARNGYETLDARLDAEDNSILNNRIEVAKIGMKPKFVEYFASYSKYGLGTPSGISNYTGGNYVLGVTGNAGDTFVTVTTGKIADAGGAWPCVIQNDDGIFDLNKVMSNDGVNKINLYTPLKKNITSGKLGNLHDAALGQHYTELGYFAFAQKFYFENPRYTERSQVLAQFLPTDTTGRWTTNATTTYNNAGGMYDVDKMEQVVGSKHGNFYLNDTTKYVEWEEKINGQKGYVEFSAGATTGTVKVEFMLDDILVDTQTITKVVGFFRFPFENAKKGKVRITPVSGTPLFLKTGRTSWFANERFQPTRLINPSDKVVYIGDSWGEFQNKATTRELERLMKADGGSPIVWNFSRGGHTSKYAKEGFKKYVLDNKPDKVIIEYFTNDFNSIRGTVLTTFTATDGTQQDMNIKDLAEYIATMQWMIDKAIENGIQPIIIMPNGTNSESQAQSFADFNNQVWNGVLISSDELAVKKLTSDIIYSPELWSKDSSKVGEGLLKLVSKEVNSSIRKGVVSDSGTGANLTGGDIHGFYNNGTRKAAIRYDGTVDAFMLKVATQTGNISASAANEGVVYAVNATGTNNVTELRVVLKNADGTFKLVKFLTQDV